ncbi:MAG TPA: hypothetical protein VFZ08_10335 [Terriglobia bacterium]|nr:hypothetical protein [Terriglobia bacterium]
MAGVMATLDRQASLHDVAGSNKDELYVSICRLCGWLERNDYRGYDTFDGLNSRLLRPFTLNSKFLRAALQQGIRRFPLNLRPLVGIAKSHSSKGMAFLARGFVRLHQVTGEAVWRDKAEFALRWLMENQASGYHGASWGNHFDYQARNNFYLPKGVPTVVWTSLIGHAFLDGYEHFQNRDFLRIAVSSCEHILNDLDTLAEGSSLCIAYTPIHRNQVHNANCLAAGLLARTYGYTRNESYLTLAEKAIQYTAQHQRPDSSWYYGEAANQHWIDNFHTAYVLDAFKHYIEGSGDDRFRSAMIKGYEYWKHTFFLPDGTPKYYHHKTKPIDIQCCSQAIDTLVYFHDLDPESLPLALKVAQWTIKHMQDPTGYFYYRRYSRWLVNKTPTLHWGQATMLCALAGLYRLV